MEAGVVAHKERKHSIFGGSSAIYPMSGCTAYFSIIGELPPEEPGEDANLGTTFHEMMEIVVHDYLMHKIEGTDPEIRYHLLQSTSGIDDEMRSHIEECKNLLWEKGLDKHITGKAFTIEEVYRMGSVGGVDIEGPQDFTLFYKDKKGARASLTVDWKYGYTYVDEAKSVQLKHYACSTYQEMKRLGINLDYVRAAIVQPRAGGDTWREVKYTAATLEKETKKFLQVAEDVFINSKIKFKAGDHCEWCKARGSCPTRQEYLAHQSGIQVARTTPLPKVETLTDEQRVKILTYKDDITNFLKAVYSDTIRRIKAGKKIPGLKVVEGTAKRKWKEDKYEIGRGLKDQGIENPFRPVETELKTITDIEKELKKLKGNAEDAKTILQTYTEYGTVPEILVPESDQRPGIMSYKDKLLKNKE